MSLSWIWKNSKIYQIFESSYRLWKRRRILIKLQKKGYVIPDWCQAEIEWHDKDPCYGIKNGFLERDGEHYCLTSCGFHKKDDKTNNSSSST